VIQKDEQMIRVMVMAKDTILVQAIASILAAEIGPNVLHLTYLEPRTTYEVIRDHRSMVIVIDEGASENDSSEMPDSFREAGPLLVIKASLKTRNILIDQSYQLVGIGSEQVTNLVKDFCGTHLRKNGEVAAWAI
jgi:hypothetical protein